MSMLLSCHRSLKHNSSLILRANPSHKSMNKIIEYFPFHCWIFNANEYCIWEDLSLSFSLFGSMLNVVIIIILLFRAWSSSVVECHMHYCICLFRYQLSQPIAHRTGETETHHLLYPLSDPVHSNSRNPNAFQQIFIQIYDQPV